MVKEYSTMNWNLVCGTARFQFSFFYCRYNEIGGAKSVKMPKINGLIDRKICKEYNVIKITKLV